MCTNPKLILNPNFKSKTGKYFKKDTSSKYIPIPCGHCAECMATRSIGLIQRCELEEITGHPFMLFFSYKNSMIPRTVCSDGTVIKYADFNDLTSMFKRVRLKNLIGRPFRYLAVSERGGKKGRPHFHVLLYVQKHPDDTVYYIQNLEDKLFKIFLSEWKRNTSWTVSKKDSLIQNRRSPHYEPLCTFVEYRVAGKLYGTYGCHYVAPFSDGNTLGAAGYVTKYFLKRDEHTQRLQQALKINLPSYEYEKVWNKVKTRTVQSLNFGFGLYDSYNARSVSRSERLEMLSKLPAFHHVADSLLRSIQSDQDSPRLYQVTSGSPVPLSRYFYHIPNLYNSDVYDHFKEKSNKFGDYVHIEERSRSFLDQVELSKSKRLAHAFNHTDITDLIP